MLDPDLIERIRAIFLHEEAYVSISDATALLGWSPSRMNDALDAGEIETVATCSGEVIPAEELLAVAVDLWPVDMIEESLGEDAASVLPEAIRTRELSVRLPSYQVAMLDHFAEQQRTTANHVLARELDGIASGHFDELRAAIDGFAEAFEWPSAL